MARGLMTLVERWFFWLAAIVFMAIIAYGFSFTVDQNLLHPPSPRPSILYVHAVIFVSWLLLFFAQTSLVRAHQIRLHRRLGLLGIALGTALAIVGVSTALVMARWHLQRGGTDDEAFLIVPLSDVTLFSCFFSAAILLRRRPEFHRRLMFIATCTLLSAGFGRFPASIVPENWFYVGVDLLVLLAIGRDLLTMRRVHVVFLIALPTLVAVHLTAIYSFVTAAPWWMGIAHKLLA